jgi:hypothetical protein
MVASVGVSQARAISPLDFMERFLANPANAFDQPVRKRKPATAPAQTPLLDVPLPHLRPAAAGDAALGYQPTEDAGVPGSEIVAEPTNDVPIPHLRPTDLLPALTERPTLTLKRSAEGIDATAAIEPPPPPVLKGTPAPAAKLASLAPEPKPTPPAPKLIRPPPAATSTCGMAIAQLGVIATPLAPIEEGDECGMPEPVAVEALNGGSIRLVNKAIVDCHVAEQLASWVNDTVAPEVKTDFNEELTGLRIADAYSCRTRGNIEGAKLSEHAKGNAIDIAAFRVGKRWIDVKSGWGSEGDDAKFLADVRKSACGPFTTVLGPGSDSYHTDHFHLDMIKRRTAGPSKGLYCK